VAACRTEKATKENETEFKVELELPNRRGNEKEIRV